MCNGFSHRTSLGGAVANLQSTSLDADIDDGFSSFQLHFHNPLPPPLPTEVSYTFAVPECEIRIHNLGDLTGGVQTAGEILFSLEVAMEKADGLPLDRRLDLGVGGDGIIGRSVSVVRKGVVLGEGIIGWN
ncbi:hypothetical protein BZA05DRAFT_444459 [Tricharina praecox]|uniref:uncharacterized protein n=1 Tax=Tricharina praecox TaxID=43433 RepID=UPI00221F32C4|nr:uncharacterized protein BZA05DRAFT_444459 [Tricharina praecox]KAI5853446.1 hypothetical protein BZA05DRAFT_444459 [Tricharina praecox]